MFGHLIRSNKGLFDKINPIPTKIIAKISCDCLKILIYSSISDKDTGKFKDMYKGQDDKGNLIIWWLDSFLKKTLGSWGSINTFVLVYMGQDSAISIEQQFEKIYEILDKRLYMYLESKAIVGSGLWRNF